MNWKPQLLLLIKVLSGSSETFSGEIAFTFDDAPGGDSAIMSGMERTELLIDALKQSRVDDALFFVMSKNIDLEGGRSRLQRYVDSGFHLANHSHSHRSANKINSDEFMVDAYKSHLALKPFDSTLPYFRFPYLHYGSSQETILFIQDALSELGYKNGYVTVDNFDWYINSALNKAKASGKSIDFEALEKLYVSVIWSTIQFYDNLAKTILNRSPKHVLLLHANDTSALFLPALADRIRSEGWKIISAQDAYRDAISNRLPDTLFHKQGRIAALASELGVEDDKLRHESENADYLDALFKQQSVFK